MPEDVEEASKEEEAIQIIERILNKQLPKYKKWYLNHNILINNNAQNILNLSTHNLTPNEISILSKGLSFIPKIKSLDIDELTRDVTAFENRITISGKGWLI